MSTRQSGNASIALATWIRSDASQRDSNLSGNFSMTKGGSASKSKYARLEAVIRAEPPSMTTRNRQSGRSKRKRRTLLGRTGSERDLFQEHGAPTGLALTTTLELRGPASTTVPRRKS